MKKFLIAMLLIAALLCTSCLAAEETRQPADYSGRWVDPYYGRAALTIRRAFNAEAPENEIHFDISIHWGNSADSEGVWLMDGVWNPEDGNLTYTNGSMAIVTYAENGDVANEDVQWEDAEGAFTLNEEGIMLWQDSREERAAEFKLERILSQAPSVEEFAVDYFECVAAMESGTAGASLKMAIAAHDVLQFAFEHDLWNTDIPTMRENMLAAWETLDDETRGRFDENMFGSLTAFMNDVFVDYEGVAGLFDDVDLGDDMSRLAHDDDAMACWDTLISHTATMGNSED